MRTVGSFVRSVERFVRTAEGLCAASECFVANAASFVGTVASFVGTVGRTRALPGGDGGARVKRGLPGGVAVSSAGRYVGCQ